MDSKNLIRALRLPFITASVLPFIAGSLLAKGGGSFLRFFFGLTAVASMHLSANLINDYADSKSGADWSDKNFYGFFGGSKLIQEKVLTERFYLYLSLFFSGMTFFSVLCLAWLLKDLRVLSYFFLILFLSFSYSVKPLQLSYRKWGEVIIFILFGPACTMGGYYLQTGIFPEARSFLLSLPFGFFTSAILLVNEIPDYADDQRAGKNTWVSFTGSQNAFLIYAALVLLGFLSVAGNILAGNLGLFSLFAFLPIIFPFRAVKVLMLSSSDKGAFMSSSKLTVQLQLLTGIIMIGDLWL